MLKSLEDLKDGQILRTTNIFIFIRCHFFAELRTSYMKLICRMLKNSLREKRKRWLKKNSSSFTYLSFLFKLSVLKFRKKIPPNKTKFYTNIKVALYIFACIFKFIFLFKKKRNHFLAHLQTKCTKTQFISPKFQPTDYWPRNVTIRKSNFPVATPSPSSLPLGQPQQAVRVSRCTRDIVPTFHAIYETPQVGLGCGWPATIVERERKREK